jgi:hypothetical protein
MRVVFRNVGLPLNERENRSLDVGYTRISEALPENALGYGSILGPQPGGRARDSSRNGDF